MKMKIIMLTASRLKNSIVDQNLSQHTHFRFLLNLRKRLYLFLETSAMLIDGSENATVCQGLNLRVCMLLFKRHSYVHFEQILHFPDKTPFSYVSQNLTLTRKSSVEYY